MKKYNVHQPFYSLIFLFVFLTSCNGQEKPKLSEHNPETNELTTFPLKLNVKKDTAAQISEYVVDVFEDTKGNLWFGTMSDGAVRYDGKTLTYFSVKDGLCDNTVVSIAEDKEGNIWFGTEKSVCYYDRNFFITFTN